MPSRVRAKSCMLPPWPRRPSAAPRPPTRRHRDRKSGAAGRAGLAGAAAGCRAKRRRCDAGSLPRLILSWQTGRAAAGCAAHKIALDESRPGATNPGPALVWYYPPLYRNGDTTGANPAKPRRFRAALEQRSADTILPHRALGDVGDFIANPTGLRIGSAATGARELPLSLAPPTVAHDRRRRGADR